MGFFEHDDTYERQAYEQFQNTPREHEAKFSHELIAGAASFEAMRAYEQHQAQNGKPQSFAMAKELLAGFAGAEVDKLIETKGLDEFDSLRAKHDAREQVSHALAQSQEYGEMNYNRQPYSGGGGGGEYENRGGQYGGNEQYRDQGQQGGNPYGWYEGQGQGYGGPAQGGYEGQQWGQPQGQQGDYGGQGGYDNRGQGGYGGSQQGQYGQDQGQYGQGQGQYGQGQGQYGGRDQGQEFEGERRHHGHHQQEERREGW